MYQIIHIKKFYGRKNHSFVIIDNNEQAVDINYFGFLLSSNMSKSTYPYNEVIKKIVQTSYVKIVLLNVMI